MNPSEPPPPYDDVTARPPNTNNSSNTNTTYTGPSSSNTNSSHLNVPTDPSAPSKSSSGIPPHYRRSMEDENRPLPTGWIRQYDTQSHHQFFVDTTAHPPRSIWHHPYDDETYLATLSPAERARATSIHSSQSNASGSSSTDEGYHGQLPPRPAGSSSNTTSNEPDSLGRRLKDRLTGTTHAEREAQRAQQDAEERAIYEQHLRFRAAMARAMETGEPQFLGKDGQGREVFVEPPYGPGGGPGYAGGAYGVSPYARGVYANPNARFVRPQGPYGRPGGMGYGGGMGMPLMPMMLMGGLGTGMMMGSIF